MTHVFFPSTTEPKYYNLEITYQWTHKYQTHPDVKAYFLPTLHIFTQFKNSTQMFSIPTSYSEEWSQLVGTFTSCLGDGFAVRYPDRFLGGLAKLQKATISFIMSVCPCGTIWLPPDKFLWNLVFGDFSKICQKIQVSLQYYKNNGNFIWRPVYIYDNTSLNVLRMRHVSDKICRENPNTCFMYNIFFFWKSCCLWAKVEK